MVDVVFGTEAAVVGNTAANDYSLAVIPTSRNVAAGSGNFNHQDRQFLETFAASVEYEALVNVQANGHTLSVQNLTPEIASYVDGDWRRVQDGVAKVRFTAASGQRTLQFYMQKTGAEVLTSVENGLAAGSLGRALADQLDALIAGKTASDTTQKVFTSRIPFTRNPSLFVQTDMTGIAAYATQEEAMTPDGSAFLAGPHGVLISPRHVMSVTHWFPRHLGFYDSTGVVQTANVVGQQQMNIPGIGLLDTSIGYLDREIPNCKVYKVFPQNWREYIPTHATYKDIPALQIVHPYDLADQTDPLRGFDKWVRICEIEYLPPNPLAYQQSYLTLRKPRVTARIPWRITPIQGNSGSHFFAYLNGELILLASLSFGGLSSDPEGSDETAGVDLAYYRPEINAIMANLKNTYNSTGLNHELQVYDLSAFPSWPVA